MKTLIISVFLFSFLLGCAARYEKVLSDKIARFRNQSVTINYQSKECPILIELNNKGNAKLCSVGDDYIAICIGDEKRYIPLNQVCFVE